MNTSTIPELTDKQIDSMRFAIMSDITKSARAKTHRYRQVAVSAVAVVALGGIGVQVIGSGSGSMNDSASSAVAGDSSLKATSPEAASGAAAGSADKLATPDTNREIITTGSVQMTVAKPPESAQKISRWVDSIGGRVDSRSEMAPEGDNGGSVMLLIRIPQTKVTASIDELNRFGKVDNISLSDNDVTTQGKDLDARIGALRISVDRLQSIMKNSASTTELIKAESALTERQANLEGLVAQRKGLSEQADLSSIEVQLTAKPMANSVSPSGFWGGIVTGWNSLVSTIDGFVHGLGVILPWGLAIGLLSGAAWLVTRRKSTGAS